MNINRILIITLFCCGLFVQRHCYAQEFEYIFEEFTDALPDDFVHTLASDPLGNLWGSTRQGVFIYDGVTVENVEEFQQFELVDKMAFDENGMIWFRIAKSPMFKELPFTQIYNPKTKHFSSISEYCTFIDSAFNFEAATVPIIDRRHKMWLIQNQKVFNYRNDSIISIVEITSDAWDLNVYNNSISYPKKDPKPYLERINLLTKKKIDSLEIGLSSNFSMIYQDKFILKGIFNEDLSYSLYDQSGILLENTVRSAIGRTENNEVIYLSFLDKIYTFSKQNKQLSYISTNGTIMEGKTITKIIFVGNSLWLNTNNGLFRMYKKEVIFEHKLTDSKYRVRRIIDIGEEKLLIATDRFLFYKDLKKDTIIKYDGHYMCSNAFLWNDSILHACVHGKGLKAFTLKDRHTKIEAHPNYDANSNGFYYCSFDADSIILFSRRDGLFYKNKSDNIIAPYPSQINTTISYIEKNEREGYLFLFGESGLFELNLKTKKINQFDALSQFHISAILKIDTHPNEYWISTKYGGLIRWHRKKGLLQQWTKKEGLSNHNIHCAYPDERGRLWMSSDWGINVLDIESNEISVLTKKDGLKENEMNRYAHYQSDDGKLYFGSQKGYFSFFPNQFEFKIIDKPVTFKYLKYILPRSEQDYKIDIASNYQSGVYLKRKYINPKLILSPPPTGLSQELRYRFGDKTGWQYVEHNEINLKEVRKSTKILISRKNGFNSWTAPEEFNIYYQLPIYQRTWFVLSAILFLASIIICYLIYLNYRRKIINIRIRKEIKLRTQELEVKNEKLQASKQLNEQIFSIIGHDLRSPIISLNNVSQSIEYLIEAGEEKELKKLGISIEKSATKLLNLVDKLLQWGKAQRIALNTSRNLIVRNEVNESIQHFFDLTRNKKINILFLSQDCKDEINADKESFQIILRNLIHNSIKFSNPGQDIRITIEQEPNLKLIIEDEGVGFPHEILAKFNAGELLDSRTGTRGEIGSGIGLSLCKELVLKMGAILQIKSIPGEGSTFTILFPNN